jgi:hypothetical protein
MILRIILSVFIAAVAFFLAGPIQYYFRTAPQRAAFTEMARESEDEIKRVGPSFSSEDYHAAMQRLRDREARARQLLAEKNRIRNQTRVIAIGAFLVVGAGAFAALSLFKRRRTVTPTTGTQPSSP